MIGAGLTGIGANHADAVGRIDALDQRDLDLPDLRKVQFGLRGVACPFEGEQIGGIATDLAG
jgi:hypothetical protein